MNYMIDELIKYKQWVTIDRSNSEEHVDDFNNFLDKLASMFFELTEHHFIAKKQSKFLTVKKVSLKFDEVILILDFAENYLFVVQDCVHWNNAQATIHPFILHYLNPKTKEISSASFSFIRDHMTYNTITVYTLLKTFINDHIKTRYPFLKRKNSNLLMHKNDCGMKGDIHFITW